MDAAFSYDHLSYGERNQTSTPTKQASEPSQTSDTDSASSASTTSTVTDATQEQPRQDLQSEFQETIRAFSNSPWGAALGGFWGNVRKQGETYYTEVKKEAGALGADALKEIEVLRSKVVAPRSRSNTVKPGDAQEEVQKDLEGQGGASATGDSSLEENETFITRFKVEAAKRLKEVQSAEDAADEALARFGTNLRNFLRDAVSVSAPEPASGKSTDVLFESRDALTGKRVIHSSRMDAQLHVIHTTLSSFSEEPTDAEWTTFKEGFDIEKKTADIARDLEKYQELRSAMETLVPEKVEYKDFWTRYYFLRHVIETQEEKRREMLKASANDDEQVGWDEDSDSESENKKETKPQPKWRGHKASDSTSTLQAKSLVGPKSDEPRRSHDEKSVADSEASYDLVSGATSRAPGSPKESKGKDDDSEEDDWE